MLHSKSLGSTTILNAWRSFSLRQLSTNLTQDRKLVITKHLVQPNIDPSSGKTALHDPKRSTHRNGRPVKPPPRALARPGLPHQAPGDSKTRSTSVIPCHLYRNTRRHKLVTSIPSEWGEYSESWPNCESNMQEVKASLPLRIPEIPKTRQDGLRHLTLIQMFRSLAIRRLATPRLPLKRGLRDSHTMPL